MGLRVFCFNKESGCDWQGELGQLDQHLNLNPDRDKQFQGCAYIEVTCLYCNEPHPRHEIEHHQTSQCAERPFTCSLCEEYESTYTDVFTNHSPVCKCRLLECPNSCGTNNLQHQHLEEHVSTQCPLSYMECEFSDAGCDAKVYRKDLPSHLGENMVTHMSLLARENRKLKQQLTTKLQLQREEHEAQLKEHGNTTRRILRDLLDLPPVKLCYGPSLKKIVRHPYWISKPFCSHPGGYILQLEIHFRQKVVQRLLTCFYECNFKDSFSMVPPSRIPLTAEVYKIDGNSPGYTLGDLVLRYKVIF